MYPFRLLFSIPNQNLLTIYILYFIATIFVLFGATFNGYGLGLLEIIGGNLALLFLLKNGTFIKSKFFKGVLLSISLLFFGFLFKLLHWSYGNEIILIGFLAIFSCYLLHFFRKDSKTALDIAKLCYAVLWLFLKIDGLFHLYSEMYSTYLILILEFSMITFITLKNFKTKNWIEN